MSLIYKSKNLSRPSIFPQRYLPIPEDQKEVTPKSAAANNFLSFLHIKTDQFCVLSLIIERAAKIILHCYFVVCNFVFLHIQIGF